MNNASDFYEQFKQAIHFLDLSWSDKQNMRVYISGPYFAMEYGGKKAGIKMEKIKRKKK